jgi:predicted Co/Zn/Cd cation transporter (cation efflux family)
MNSVEIIERKALRVSLASIVILMIWSIVFSEVSDSNIVSLDAGSYAISGIIGLVSLYVSQLVHRNASEDHPLGYYAYVHILNLLRNTMIILICIDGIVESTSDIIDGPKTDSGYLLILYSFGTLFFNCITYYYIQKMTVESKSDILKTEAIEWRIDVFFTLSILLSFIAIYFLKEYNYVVLSNYIDPVVCIIMSIYMAKDPILLFKENIDALSIKSVEPELKVKIIDHILKTNPRLKEIGSSYRIFRINGILWLDLEMQLGDVEVIDGKVLVLATDQVEEIMKEYHPNAKVTYKIK